MTIDVARARQDTPGCTHRIHFNNAGASLMTRPVIDTIKAHLDLESEMGGYEAGHHVADRHAGVYRSVARLIGAKPSEIGLFENATTAWDLAFHGAVAGLGLGKGDTVLTTVAEYCSNHTGLVQLARRYGYAVEVVPDDESGQVSLEALEQRLTKGDIKLMSLVHMPTNGGLINPAEDVGALTQAAGVPLFLDAAQTAGQVPIDVDAIGCDLLSAPGRKALRGPRGTGFLYVRDSFLPSVEPMLANMRAIHPVAADDYAVVMEGTARLETWEGSMALQLGLGAAIDYALDMGIGAIGTRMAELAEGLRDRLGDIEGVTVMDKGTRKGGIVTAALDSRDPAEIVPQLAAQKITVNYSPAFMSYFDTQQRDLPPLLRASVHVYNTEDEVDRFANALEALLR